MKDANYYEKRIETLTKEAAKERENSFNAEKEHDFNYAEECLQSAIQLEEMAQQLEYDLYHLTHK